MWKKNNTITEMLTLLTGPLIANKYLLRKTKTDDVTPAKAGVQSEKLSSRFRGNDKYCFRNRN